MEIVFAVIIWFLSLFIAATIGYGMGSSDGYKNGFQEGVDSEKLRTIEKLEPIWKQDNGNLTNAEIIKALECCGIHETRCTSIIMQFLE